jgi:hypothetical protein
VCALYSDWFRLKKAVAWLLRLKDILRKRTAARDSFLLQRELHDAERVVIAHVQCANYAKEFKRLSSGRALPDGSPVKALDPFLASDGYLRVGGRLRQTQDTSLYCHPILIPHAHVVASLIARHHHGLAHLGMDWVIGNGSKLWRPVHSLVFVEASAKAV